MLLMIQIFQDHKKFPTVGESSNACFHAEAKDSYRQLYYEVLDSAIFGLIDHLEPEAAAVHLTNIENFTI